MYEHNDNDDRGCGNNHQYQLYKCDTGRIVQHENTNRSIKRRQFIVIGWILFIIKWEEWSIIIVQTIASKLTKSTTLTEKVASKGIGRVKARTEGGQNLSYHHRFVCLYILHFLLIYGDICIYGLTIIDAISSEHHLQSRPPRMTFPIINFDTLVV